MEINYNHQDITLTYAHISKIEIDNDFRKELEDNKGNKTIIKGRILVSLKLYPKKESYEKGYEGFMIPRFENIPIEGLNFDFCKNELTSLRNVLEGIIKAGICNS